MVSYMKNINDIANYFGNKEYIDAFDFSESIVEFKNNLKEISKIIKGINIKKDYKIESIKEIAMPPEVVAHYNGINYKNIIEYVFCGEVSKFARIMTTNFSSDSLIILYNNINELKMEKIHLNEKKEHFKNKFLRKGLLDLDVASYNVVFNRIRVSGENVDLDLPHELFHMSSSVNDNDNDMLYCGFEQTTISNNKTIGIGFNEGYTELMVKKYYGDSILSNSTNYMYLRDIAENIELIIGRSKMEKYYLSANLKGFITELSKYSSFDKAIDFIATTDYLYKHLNEARKRKKEKEFLIEKIKFIYMFIVECITRSTIKLLEDKKINEDYLLPIISKKVKTLKVSMSKIINFKAIPNVYTTAQMIVDILNEYGLDMIVDVEKSASIK